jgi:hypothetical protein
MITSGHFLDGREFRGTMRSVESFPSDDVISFRDGKFRSRYLALHGFPEGIAYTAYLEKEASEADRLVVSLKSVNKGADEQLSLSAVVEGNDIDIRLEITRAGEQPEYLHFSGTAPAVFRNDYYSLGA